MINLQDLEDKLDKALSNETEESLTKWIMDKRNELKVEDFDELISETSIAYEVGTVNRRLVIHTKICTVAAPDTELRVYHKNTIPYQGYDITKAISVYNNI